MNEVKLDKLIIHFAQSNKAEGKSPKTISWYSEMLSGFSRFLKSQGCRAVLSDFGVDSVREFVVHEQERAMSPYTVQGKVRALKACSSWLFREGYTADNLLCDIKLPRVPSMLIKPLTVDEIDQLVDYQNPLTAIGCRDIAILILMIDTGIRLSELCGLHFEDAHVEEGYLKVMGKGSKERIVPVGAISASIAAELQSYCYRTRIGEGERIFAVSRSQAFRIVTEAFDKAGIPRPSKECDHVGGIHILRHSGAIERLRITGNPKAVQDQLRHRSALMTMKYLKTLSADESLKIQQGVELW